MKRYAIIGAVILAAGLILVVGTGASSGGSSYQIRAIFDDASFLTKGEDVKIAGAKVGSISHLDVTKDKKAAITLDITQAGFADFRQDAHCIIRPQSLIGEQFVECTPTVPKSPGGKQVPALDKVRDGEPGAGQHLLPVQTRYGGGTSSPVGLDQLNDTLRLPFRQRLALIISELGTGLAGNATELRNVIHRANPAFAELDKVLAILARENQTLASTAKNGDTSLAPLARDKARVADFITKAANVADATAQRRADLEANLQRFPTFLAELRPTARRIGIFSDQTVPLLAVLRPNAPAINAFIKNLGPFANASLPAFRSLGRTAVIGGPALQAALPVARQTNRLGKALQPVAKTLDRILTSFHDTGGIERLMDYAFYQTTAVNGFDNFGHYLRAGLITVDGADNLLGCQLYSSSVEAQKTNGCSANFPYSQTSGAPASAASARKAYIAGLRRQGYKIPAKGAKHGQGARRAAPKANVTPSAPARTAATQPVPAAAPATRRSASSGLGSESRALLDYLLGGTK